MDLNGILKNATFTNGEDLTIQNPNETRVSLRGDTITPKIAEYIKINEQRNMNILKNGFSVIKDITYINLEQLCDPPDDWQIFNKMNEESKSELKHSILNYGLFTPLIVWKQFTGDYMVLSGVERSDCFVELCNEAPEELKYKYEKVPCFVFEKDEINDVIARIIRIDSNICVRNMSTECKNRAICMKYSALKFLNKTRKELNVLDELANSFNMSRTQITNHLSTLKVIEEFLYLFQEGKLSLKSIKKLSKFSKEDQKKIYEGIDNVKEHQISALREDEINDKKGLEQSIRILNNLKEPYYSTINIKLPTKFLDAAIEVIENLIRKNPSLYMKLRKKKKPC